MQTGKLNNQNNQAYTTIDGQLPDATGDFSDVLSTTNIIQESGQATDKVMSQKAVTDLIDSKLDKTTYASETVFGVAKMWVDAEGTLHISTEE